MVQNVPAQNQTANQQQGGGGLLNSVASTATTALPGVVMGGAVGGVMSIIPPGKKAITKQLADVFVAESKKEIKSKEVLRLLNRPEVIEAKKKFGADAMGAIEELMNKLPKNDELIKLAKKSARRG